VFSFVESAFLIHYYSGDPVWFGGDRQQPAELRRRSVTIELELLFELAC